MESDHQAINNIFGYQLSQLRKKHGRSQKFVAIEAKLDASYLAAVEHGRRPPPKQPVIDRLLSVLSATTEERLKISSSVGMDKLARIATTELEPEYGYRLIRIAAAMQSCSREELIAIEVILQGFHHRRSANTEETNM